MTTIKIITCKPSKFPEEVFFSTSIETWMDFLLDVECDDSANQPDNIKQYGWFEVLEIEKNLILYCLENPVNKPFNRMVRERPIFGNFIVSKINSNGKKIDISDSEVIQLITELSISKPNNTN